MEKSKSDKKSLERKVSEFSEEENIEKNSEYKRRKENKRERELEEYSD